MPAIAHTSYWQQTAGSEAGFYPPLRDDIHVDVAILGAGITGLTAAWHLKQAGKRVAVLEGSHVGSGTSGYTSGHLDATTDTSLTDMIFEFGEKAAAVVAQANREAIDLIEVNCRRWPDCEFQRIPSFQYIESADGLAELQKQCAAEKKLGYNSWFTRQVPLPFDCVGAVRTEGQGRFHPLRYLHHLAAAIHGDGSIIFEGTRALPPDDGTPCKVHTDHGEVTADTVIVATHSPFLGISNFDFRAFPYQSYVLTARVREVIDDALYWDDADPYHYIRLASPHETDLLIIGGCDHKTGQPLDERERFRQLEQYTHDRFPGATIEQEWSAQLYVPADGLPYVGRVPTTEHLYIATGFNGTGLTWGTVAGVLLGRMLQGQRHPLEDILAPGRLTFVASARDVITENLDVMRRFVVDRFAHGKSLSDDQIAPGAGCVVARQGRLVALYRDDAGKLHRFSPVCTHAGCIVHWNEAERTWDCPCHGGRYSADGQRFSGPPPRDLKPDPEPDGNGADRAR
jgi:glycine/D-amino acid oxidase-like deaminating enzyme/nitrite reductase/ring-hydroxylating ferredoxin subunit